MALQVSIKTEHLTLGDLMDLEEAGKSPKATANWLIVHCGVAPEDVRTIPWEDLPAINAQIMAEIKERQALPKAMSGS
jgi:hypothetical protein